MFLIAEVARRGDGRTILVLKMQELFHLFLVVEAGVRRSGRLRDVVDLFHKVVAARSTDLRCEQDMLIDVLHSGRRYWHSGL